MATKAKGTIEIEVKGDRFKSTLTDFISTLTKFEGQAKSAGTSLKTLGSSAQGAVSRMNTLHSVTSRASNTLDVNARRMANLGQQTVHMAQKAQGAVLPVTKLDTALNNTNRSAIQLGNQGAAGVNKFSNAANQAGNSAQRMGGQMGQATQATSRFNAGTIGTAASIGTMGAGLVSLEASMSNYTKAAQKVDKAEQGLQKTRDLLQTNSVSLQRAELRLEKMLKSGNKTREELAAAEANVLLYKQKIKTATTELTVKEQDLNIALMDQADTHKTMAASIATTLLGTLSAAASMIQAKTASSIKDTMATNQNTATTKKNSLAVLANSRVLKMLGIDLKGASKHFSAASSSMKGFSFSLTGARAGLSGVASGFKGLYAAMGPVGLAILAATAIWQAWENNALGFRDAIHWVIDELQKLWESLKGLLPIFGMIENGLKSIGINLGESVDQWQEADKAIYQADETMQHADATVNTLSGDMAQATDTIQMTEGAAVNLDASMGAFGETVDTVAGKIQGLTHTMSADMAMMQAHTNATGAGQASLEEFGAKMREAAKDAKDHERDLADNKHMVLQWANAYKDSMTAGSEASNLFVDETRSDLQTLTDNITKYGGDARAVLEQNGIDWQNLGITIGTSMVGAGQSVSTFATNTEAGMGKVRNSMASTKASAIQLMHMMDQLSKKKHNVLNDLSNINDASQMTQAQIEAVTNAYNNMKQNEFLLERGLPPQGKFYADEAMGSVYVMGDGETALNPDGSINYEKLQRMGNISARNLAKIKEQSRSLYNNAANQYLAQLGLVTAQDGGKYHSSVGSKEDLATVSQMAQTNNYANPNNPTQGVDYGTDYSTAQGGNTPSGNWQYGSDSKRGVEHRNQRDHERQKQIEAEIEKTKPKARELGVVNPDLANPPKWSAYGSYSPGRHAPAVADWSKKVFAIHAAYTKLEKDIGRNLKTATYSFKEKQMFSKPGASWSRIVAKTVKAFSPDAIAEARQELQTREFGNADQFAAISQAVNSLTQATSSASNLQKQIGSINTQFGTDYKIGDFYRSFTTSGARRYRLDIDKESKKYEILFASILNEQRQAQLKEMNEALARQLAAQEAKDKQERAQAQYQSEMKSYNQDMALYNMIKQMFPGMTPSWTPTRPTMQAADPRMGFYNWLDARGFANADAAGVDAALRNDPSIFNNEFVRGEFGTHAEFAQRYDQRQTIEVFQK